MRTSRGLKLASFVVLSPILLIILSLFSIITVFICSHLMSWSPVMKIFSPIISLTHISSTSYPLHCTKSARNPSFYTSLRQSPFIWCIIILIYVIYVVHKKSKCIKETTVIERPKQKQQKRQKKTERQFKNQPVLTGDEMVDPVSSHEWTQIGEKVKKKKKRKNRTKAKKNNNKNEPSQPQDFNLISPAITPVTSEDESEIAKPKRLYSPFLTGLDLDILPRTDPLVQYRIDSFLHSVPPPSPPLLSTDYISSSRIPSSSFESVYPRPISIKMLENHPFISTSSGENAQQHHHHHHLGPIGGSIRSYT